MGAIGISTIGGMEKGVMELTVLVLPLGGLKFGVGVDVHGWGCLGAIELLK